MGPKIWGSPLKVTIPRTVSRQGTAWLPTFHAPPPYVPQHGHKHTHWEDTEETNVFIKTLWEPSSQSHQGFWKASHQQGERSHFKQNFMTHKLLKGHLPQGSERENMAGNVSTRSVSKVARFWKVRVGWILSDPLRQRRNLSPARGGAWPKATQWVSAVARLGVASPASLMLQMASNPPHPAQGLSYSH